MTRRDFLKNASLVGAALAFGQGNLWASTRAWRERRDLYPEGVASGDPRPDSVLLWTRRPPVNGSTPPPLTLEIAEDNRFTHVVAAAHVTPVEASDWTCRVLAAGLTPSRVYWFRFTDEHGNGSRVGRTITAPADADSRPVRFAFVCCQNANLGAQNAYRRMILDAGRTYGGGHPPATIRYAGKDVPNARRDKPAPSMLGVEQKAWFLTEVKASRAKWKIWANTQPTLTGRGDPQNLPEGGPVWGGAGYAVFGGGDWSGAIAERGEIFDALQTAGITGFAIVSGDRHAFWAGMASTSLPPKPLRAGRRRVRRRVDPAPGVLEAAEHGLPNDVPFRPMYLADRQGSTKPDPTINMLLRHGVRSALDTRSSDLSKARALSNPELAPHLSLVDVGGHGYAAVRATADTLDTEFVCLPRPIERSAAPDGGPLRYRVSHRTRLWARGERPQSSSMCSKERPSCRFDEHCAPITLRVGRPADP